MRAKNGRGAGGGLHEFTLILSGVSEISDDLENAVFEAGCDDALLASRGGVVFLEFGRAAPTFREAVLSAVRDVRRAGYAVARVEPDDLVTLAEIARRVGRTRESVRQQALGLRGPGGFPPPVASVKGTSPLWRWAEVAPWFKADDAAGLDRAATVAALNDALDLLRRAGKSGALSLVRQLGDTGK
jgi:hypothetical protein